MSNNFVTNSEIDRIIAQFQKTTDALTDLVERNEEKTNKLFTQVAVLETTLNEVKEHHITLQKINAQNRATKWGLIAAIIAAILGGLFSMLQGLIF